LELAGREALLALGELIEHKGKILGGGYRLQSTLERFTDLDDFVHRQTGRLLRREFSIWPEIVKRRPVQRFVELRSGLGRIAVDDRAQQVDESGVGLSAGYF